MKGTITGIRTLADIIALEQTPLSERDLAPSTYEHLNRAAQRTPDAVALRFFMDARHFTRQHVWTYSQLMLQINQTANLLQTNGIGPTDVVSVVLPNLPEMHIALWAAQAVGQVNPINPLLDVRGLVELFQAARPKVLVTLGRTPRSDLYERVCEAACQVPGLQAIYTVDPARYLPVTKRVAARLLLRLQPVKPYSLPVLPVDFNRAITKQPETLASPAIQPDAVAALFHTGGTGGRPKLARLTHGNLVFTAWAVAQTRSLDDVSAFFCGLPLFHINGVQVTGLVPLGQGKTVVLGTPLGYRAPGLIQQFWSMVDHYGIGAMSGVPTVYQSLVDAPRATGQGKSLVFAICGAAPCSVDLHRQFEKQTGIQLLEGYGLTESACIATVNPGAGERRIGSVGLRLPYQDLRIVRLTGQIIEADCPPNEIGAVLLRGPNIMAGYVNPTDNQASWLTDGSGRWFVTGDLGRVDADGYLWLTGRQKELIIRGGHNIDPGPIEAALMRHPAVLLAAAIGRPDAYAGEVPVAYVQLRPGQAVASPVLLAYLSDQLSERASIPKAIKILDQLPLTAVGKLFKPALVQAESENAFATALQGIDGLQTVTVEARSDPRNGLHMIVRWSARPGTDPAQVRTRMTIQLSRFTLTYTLVGGPND